MAGHSSVAQPPAAQSCFARRTASLRAASGADAGKRPCKKRVGRAAADSVGTGESEPTEHVGFGACARRAS
jgi:hypothetical protein